jgi:hypothetical protein
MPRVPYAIVFLRDERPISVVVVGNAGPTKIEIRRFASLINADDWKKVEGWDIVDDWDQMLERYPELRR